MLLVVAGTGCAARSSYLAKVNDETITGADLRAEFARSHQALEKILGSEKDVRKYVDRLVDRRLFVQEGYRMSLQDRSDVRADVARFRGQKMVEAFVKEELDEKSKPTDDEVKAIHATITHRTEVRHVVVRTQAEAEAIARAVREGADLETLAREKSIAPTAKRGGLTLMGWGGDEAYEAILPGLSEGQLSPAFESKLGWEVLRVEKRTKLDPPPAYDKVAPRIRQILHQRRRAAIERAVYAELWTKYDVKILDCAPTVDDLRKAAGTPGGASCATWKGGTMTTADLSGRLKLDEVEKLQGEWPELRKTFVEEFVAREVVKLEAEARGYALRPAIADEVRRYQDGVVEGKLFADYVAKGIEAKDEDARRYYEAHQDQFVEDARYDLAHVVVETAEEAAVVLEKVKSRQPFAEIAAAHSKDKDSADKGGRIGEVEKKTLTGALAPIAALEEGGVTDVLQTKGGAYHVVKVLGVTPERQRPFDEVKEEARARALQERKAAELDRWIKQLRAAGRIEINERGIRAYEKERVAWLKEQEEADRAKAEAKKAAEAKAAAEAEAAAQAKAAAEAQAAGAKPDAAGAPSPTPPSSPAPAAAPQPAQPAAPSPR